MANSRDDADRERVAALIERVLSYYLGHEAVEVVADRDEWALVIKALRSEKPANDGVRAEKALADLVALLLCSAVPIGPMRSRKDYPSELRHALDVLHGRSVGEEKPK